MTTETNLHFFLLMTGNSHTKRLQITAGLTPCDGEHALGEIRGQRRCCQNDEHLILLAAVTNSDYR